MFGSEAVLVITQDVVHDKVVHYAAVDYMLQDFQETEVREAGLYLEDWCLSPFLNNGTM